MCTDNVSDVDMLALGILSCVLRMVCDADMSALGLLLCVLIMVYEEDIFALDLLSCVMIMVSDADISHTMMSSYPALIVCIPDNCCFGFLKQRPMEMMHWFSS